MSLGKVVWLKVRLIVSVEAGNTNVYSAFSNIFQCGSCYWDRFFPRICIIQKRIHHSPSCCWNVRARKSTGVQKKCRGGSLSVQIFFLKRNGIFNLMDWAYSLTSEFDIILCYVERFVSSVRSSNSHPHLLVTQQQHPHFFRSHRSSTLDFHFLSQYSYIKAIKLDKGNQSTHLLAIFIPYGYNRTSLQDSAIWWKILQDGARWCKMVQDGARWCKKVQDGAR